MLILTLWGEIRELFLRLDMVAFSFIDNIYSLFTAIASESLISETIVKQVLNNVYVLVGIFAFFRIAMLLINSIINPDALNKQGAGLSKIFVNTVIMLVLLVFTPTLFQMSRDLAKEVVEGNYIQKLFININDSKNTLEPGKEMQRIAIGAVITPEEGFVDETGEITCSGDCEKALQCLNTINGVEGATGDECMKDNGVAWGKLADYNGIREKDANGEKVYVYNYKPLVLTVVGWTITYILLSFTFDVAKRMIELAILEIVSPLFIATIVDPKSMQTGPFKKWLKTLGNSYGGLFLRIAAISIMLLCVRLLSYWHPAAEIGGIGKLIVLIAFLIFIKQLPKWFSNMLGMDGDGTGLGDLGIGKKIGGAALIGGLATKAGHGLAGAATGAAAAANNQLRERRANRRNARNEAGLNKGIGRKAKAARDAWYATNGGNEKYAGMSKRAAIRAARAEAYGNNGMSKAGVKQGARQLGASVAAGIISGGRAGVSADNLNGAFTGSIKAANQFGQQVGFTSKGIGQRIVDATDDAYIGLKGAYGSASEINKKIKDAEDAKKFKSWFTPEFRNNNSMDNVALGQKKFNEQFLGASSSDGGPDPMFAALALKNDRRLQNSTISTDENGIITVSNDDLTMKIDGKNRRIIDGATGMVAMEGDNYDKMVSTGEKVFGSSQEALDNYNYMWNEMQRQAVSSTIGNNNQMSNLMQQRSNVEQSIAYNTSEAAKMVTAAGLVVDGKFSLDGSKINLGDATMDQLKRAYMDSSASQNDKDRMSTMGDSVTASERSIEQLTKQIGYYQESNEKLKNTVESLRTGDNDNSTLDELLVKAEKTVDKMKKAVDAYEVQKQEK